MQQVSFGAYSLYAVKDMTAACSAVLWDLQKHFGPQERKQRPTESPVTFAALLWICLEAPPFPSISAVKHHFHQTEMIQNP